MTSCRLHIPATGAQWLGLLLLAAVLVVAPLFAQEREGGEAGNPRFTAQEVRFETGDVSLAGLLRRPSASPPYPAVVLLPGSLPTPKEDERLAAVATGFAARGFAVLTTDSRGTGGSQGDFESASLELLAAGAAAAAAMLRQRPEVRADGVGFWGVSQGGTWVGPLAAAHAEAAFLVAASGPLASPERYMHGFLAERLRGSEGLDEATIERITEARATVWSYYATGRGYEVASAAVEALRGEPWFASAGLPAAVRAPDELAALPARTRTFLQQKDFDPLAAIAGLPCPMLAVYGGEDTRLPVVEHAEVLRALAARLQARITVEVLPGVDHDLHLPAGRARGSADALAIMARWAESVLTSAGNGRRDSVPAPHPVIPSQP